MRRAAMYEIQARDGLARGGDWTFQGHTVQLPNVLYLADPRIGPPDAAEALLGRAPAPTSLPTLPYGGSVFFPAGEGQGGIPPALGLPHSLDRLGELASAAFPPEGDVAVVHGASAEPLGKPLVVMGNAVQCLRRPYGFAERLVSLRKATGYQGVLYVPGIATPLNLSLLTYGGADLVDALRIVLDSRLGRFYAAGAVEGDVQEPPGTCPCSACEAGGDGWLLQHNLSEMHRELQRVRRAVARGALRDLVELRVAAEPWMVAVLRHLDRRFSEHGEAHAPLSSRPVRAYTEASLERPEVLRFLQRMESRYRPPGGAQVLLLLPCSARKPYSLSRTHALFRRAIKGCGNPGVVHEVMVTSPLGVVPRELEVFPPAQAYDIPITGDWSMEERERVVRGIRRLLKRDAYREVVLHMGEEWLEEAVPEARVTAEERPAAPESLHCLREALREACRGLEPVPAPERWRESLRGLARVQFGAPGEALLEGAAVRGRYPNLRVFHGDAQVAMLVGDRGMLSLTLAGGRVLAEQEAYVVGIEDFELKGNLFAVGVEAADPSIRIGDDVVVAHDGDVRAVGVARMTPGEMVEATRGEAVRIRHRERADSD